VTVAEEMEQSGLPRGVVVSGETYGHISSQFDCKPLPSLLCGRNLMSRWQVLQYKGEYAAEAAGAMGEEALPLPKVAEILMKVHDANMRQMELRSRRRGGSAAGGLLESAASASQSRLQVRVDSVGGDAEADVASATQQPSLRPQPDGRRRSHSDTSVSPPPRSGGGSNSSSKATSPLQTRRSANGTHAALLADDASPFLRPPQSPSSPATGFIQPVFPDVVLGVDRRSPVAV
jgi:hypothetical protein